MKTISDWQLLQDAFLDLTSHLVVSVRIFLPFALTLLTISERSCSANR